MIAARLLFAFMLCLLGACGGSTMPTPEPGYNQRVLVQPEDRVTLDEPSFNLSIQLTREVDPLRSVALQRLQPGQIILTVGVTREVGFVGLDHYLLEAQREPRITHVYLYDELFWTGSAIELGRDESAVNSAAQKSRAAGFKTVISIMPDVILRADFALKDINAYDVLAVDVYPTARASQVVPTCRTGPNYLTSLLYCSNQKLRAMGFKGEVWYVAQAFGDDRVSPAELLAGLQLQRETIAEASSFGITGFVPFGLYFGVAEQSREPVLYPLFDTHLDSLVRHAPKGI